MPTQNNPENNKYFKLVDQIYGIERMMVENQLLLAYKDNINEETSDQLIAMVDSKMIGFDEEKKIKKRVFNVLVECLQNVSRHAEPEKGKDHESSILLIGRNENSFFIITGNMMNNDKTEGLKSKLDQINKLNPEEIRDKYKELMTQMEFSDKGGAGLGLLDIARKSANKFEYDFRKLGDKKTYFTLKVSIPVGSST
ncbi:MAG TPA: SiaB family protein kinase [Bacteroidia bacterium]|nr:SiaB family protein kinase [Bacteroidia bacterium]